MGKDQDVIREICMTDDNKALVERVWQFKTMELPGQPKMMHMGTCNLVDDLAAALEKAMREKAAALGLQKGERERDEAVRLLGLVADGWDDPECPSPSYWVRDQINALLAKHEAKT
jgi:hypothetical protein